jgi:hypothetical protein
LKAGAFKDERSDLRRRRPKNSHPRLDFDARTMKPGAYLLYALDGGTPKRVSGYPLPLPDVAAALNVPTAAKSGFVLPVNLAGLALGPHRLHFIISTSDAP